MNKRLALIADLIRDGKGLIDVGTDHGYLPVWLAEKNYSGRLLASDINPAPLASARKTASAAALEGRIEFLLCDGLELCPPEAVDTIVIAGMGGDLICRILDRAEFCMSERYTLILQPMTKAEVLRYWLVNNGFRLVEEPLVRDGGILYQVIKAQFCENMALSDAELFSGAFKNIQNEELCAVWLDELAARFRKEEQGQMSASRPDDGKLMICRGVLRGLEEMRSKLP